MVSASIGAGVWAATDSALAIPVAVASGVLIDADHLTDFIPIRRLPGKEYMVRYLHAWEYSLIGLVALATLWYHPLLMAAVLGHISHLAIDQITNPVHPLGYLIVYRASRGFRRTHLTPYWVERSLTKADEPVPMWAKLEPSLWQLVRKVRDRSH